MPDPFGKIENAAQQRYRRYSQDSAIPPFESPLKGG
jgi:hypothetical protein